MIYFPDESFDIKAQCDFGTSLYVNSNINIKNFHIDDVEKFKNSSKYTYKSNYEKTLLVGFVGGNKS
tara:strand:- start:32 stop:232 length:201 start_codon:yes stop_codon:yes gene_type:complete